MPGYHLISTLFMALTLVMRTPVYAQAATNDWRCYDAKPGHPTDGEKASFVEQISTLAKNAEMKYGVPASALAAMAIAESGYGWTRTAQNAQNLFGWKFYSTRAAGGRRAYVLTCQPKEDDNNRYVVFATIADSLDFVAMKLATIPPYNEQTKAYQASGAEGIRTTDATKTWVAGVAARYNRHPQEYTTTITRIMNNALVPSDIVSKENNLYRLSDSVVAVGSNAVRTAKVAITPIADTEAIFTRTKAKLAEQRSNVSHCDPPILDFAHWKGFPVQLCTYDENGVSVRTYMLNASLEKIAHWIANACFDIRAASPSACADKLTAWIIDASSGGVFPIAGFIPEPASAITDKKDDNRILCALFRDGVTVSFEGIDSPEARNNVCDSGKDHNSQPLLKVREFARIASTTRKDYMDYMCYRRKLPSMVDGLKWVDVLRDLYQQAWTSDRNELITAKAYALVRAGAPKKRD